MISRFLEGLSDLVGTGEKGALAAYRITWILADFLWSVDTYPAPDWYPLGYDHFYTVFRDIVLAPALKSAIPHHCLQFEVLENCFARTQVFVGLLVLSYSVTWFMWTLLGLYRAHIELWDLFRLTSLRTCLH